MILPDSKLVTKNITRIMTQEVKVDMVGHVYKVVASVVQVYVSDLALTALASSTVLRRSNMTVSWQSIFSIYRSMPALPYYALSSISPANALMDTSNQISVQVILIV